MKEVGKCFENTLSRGLNSKLISERRVRHECYLRENDELLLTGSGAGHQELCSALVV